MKKDTLWSSIDGELKHYRYSDYLKKAERITGLNHKEMAKMLKVPYRTYQNWISGNSVPYLLSRETIEHKIDLLIAIYHEGGFYK